MVEAGGANPVGKGMVDEGGANPTGRGAFSGGGANSTLDRDSGVGVAVTSGEVLVVEDAAGVEIEIERQSTVVEDVRICVVVTTVATDKAVLVEPTFSEDDFEGDMEVGVAENVEDGVGDGEEDVVSDGEKVIVKS